MRKIVVISSHTGSLFWFRMDMMKSFLAKGYEVLAVGSDNEDQWITRFKEQGIRYKSIQVSRNGLNPLKDYFTYLDLKELLKNECPDKIFTYQAKTIIYGCLAASANNISDVYPMVAGLGSIFRGRGIKNTIVKTVMSFLYKMAFERSRLVFFQNNDDLLEIHKLGLLRHTKTEIVNGSGVNLNVFKPVKLPSQMTFLFIGRLIRDKGLMEYLEACRIIKDLYPDVRCLLVGPYDSNPSALSARDLDPYIASGVIEFFGEQSDVKPFIEQCSVFVLPSYHEGTPKTVLEAMAMRRPIITTCAPGCKETVLDNVNGFLVDVKDIDGIVSKMRRFILEPHILETMATASLNISREKYDVNIVNKVIHNCMDL